MDDIGELISMCLDGEQAEKLTKDRDELERARRAYSEMKKNSK